MLKVDGLDVYYGNVQALRGVSLEVRDGEMVTMIGANGAGKTTLLKAIAGLLPPRSGRIEFGGERIDGIAPSDIVRRGISLCPEGRRVWPEMTVREHLEIGAYVHRRRGFADDLQQVYGYFPTLRTRGSQLAGSLSGGEQQMVAIGRALMSRPKLLLLDEPSLGLSPLLVEKTAEIVKQIHRAGTTVLLVEQNAYLAMRMCERAYVMETGRVAMQGASADLLADARIKRAYLGEA